MIKCKNCSNYNHNDSICKIDGSIKGSGIDRKCGDFSEIKNVATWTCNKCGFKSPCKLSSPVLSLRPLKCPYGYDISNWSKK